MHASVPNHRYLLRKLHVRQNETYSWARVETEAPVASTSAHTLDAKDTVSTPPRSGAKTAHGKGAKSTSTSRPTRSVRPSRTAGAKSTSSILESTASAVPISTASPRVSVSIVTSTKVVSSVVTVSSAHPTSVQTTFVQSASPADASVLAAAAAWSSYLQASAAEARVVRESIAAAAAWSAGPEGQAARASVAQASASAAAAAQSIFSAQSALKVRVSSLAALGTGVPLAATATNVWQATSSVDFFAPTAQTSSSSSSSSSGDGAEAQSGAAGFFQSLGKTPTSIALTTLVCVAIAAVALAALAFVLRRWCVKRRRRDLNRYPMFADEDGDYVADDKFAERDNDRWSVHSVIRRHSGDATIDPATPRPRQSSYSQEQEYEESMRTSMLGLPQLPFAATHARGASQDTITAGGYPSLHAFTGIPQHQQSPVPSLPYISWTPQPALPRGAGLGVPPSRFSSFSTVAPIMPSMAAAHAQLDRSQTSRSASSDYSASSCNTGGTAMQHTPIAEQDDEDETETETLQAQHDEEDVDDEDDDDDTLSETSSYQADRVERFRRTLSLAGTDGSESVVAALRARRQSTTSKMGEAL